MGVTFVPDFGRAIFPLRSQAQKWTSRAPFVEARDVVFANSMVGRRSWGLVWSTQTCTEPLGTMKRNAQATLLEWESSASLSSSMASTTSGSTTRTTLDSYNSSELVCQEDNEDFARLVKEI